MISYIAFDCTQPSNVKNVLASAFERLVASLKVAAPRLSQPEDLRQIVIVLQVPSLLHSFRFQALNLV